MGWLCHAIPYLGGACLALAPMIRPPLGRVSHPLNVGRGVRIQLPSPHYGVGLGRKRRSSSLPGTSPLLPRRLWARLTSLASQPGRSLISAGFAMIAPFASSL